jgi:NAD(P)-dependent dehydrogenase (short-subunit alcohol dehydrogenase family)
MKMTEMLHGKTAAVTGCGGGLGMAIALVLASHGARIAAMDRDQASVDAAVAGLEGAGRAPALGIAFDVASPSSVAEGFAALDRSFDRLDILVNCAGIREVGTIFDVEPEVWQRVLAVNLSGPFYCSREAAVRMRTAGGGCIVNVASVGGMLGLTHRPAYTASKHGLVGLTRNLATDLAPHGIRVNAVAPGTLRTPMTDEFFRDEAFVSGLATVVPLGNTGEASDVGEAVAFLCGPVSKFITGVVLPVDGGWTSGKSYAPAGSGASYNSTARPK